MNVNTSILYSGVVECSGPFQITVHNKGTKMLFSTIAKLLSLGDIDSDVLNLLPKFIMIYDQKPSQIINDPTVDAHSSTRLLTDPVEVNCAKPGEFDDNLYFSCRLSPELVVGTDVKTSISMGLIDKQQKNILAVIDFNPEYYSKLQAGYPVNVGWKLSLTNSD